MHKSILYEDKYYITVPRDFDENIQEVCGYGETELEAYKQAFKNLYNTYRNCWEAINATMNLLAYKGLYETKDEFDIEQLKNEENWGLCFKYYKEENKYKLYLE